MWDTNDLSLFAGWDPHNVEVISIIRAFDPEHELAEAKDTFKDRVKCGV